MPQDPITAIQQDLSAGRFRAARKKAQINRKKYPKEVAFPVLAARAAAGEGDHTAAAAEFAQALRLDPSNHPLRCDLAMALILSDRADRVEPLLDAVPAGSPSAPVADYMRAMIAMRRADFRAVIAAADRALAINPGMTEALNLRGMAQAELGRPAAAIADFRAALACQPANQRARENLADRLSEAGDFAAARAEYRTLLTMNPAHGHALFRLAQLLPATDLPMLAPTIEAALGARPRDPAHEALLNMAAGTLHARQGDTARATAHLNRAHAIDARARPPGTRARDSFARAERLFADPAPVAAPLGGPRPIFIVGMPRSGSTLVEMILTSAPGVASCGELVTAERLYRELIQPAAALTPELIATFAKGYRDALPDLPDDAAAFVDKMPANHAHLGLLLSAFPEARAVDMLRDPRDVAASMWMQRFAAGGMAYASSMRHIGEVANIYRRHMARWTAMFPDRILTLRYEDLVRDLEGSTHRLAEFCGIDWTPAMLTPEANTATVRTASLGQVREKVHTRSIGKWEILGGGLDELTKVLEPGLWP
ncbi:MAG: sulfotransferase [Pseudooceanicola sp.]|nr:sulfotransferase [Pseudooceanicola sp.]